MGRPLGKKYFGNFNIGTNGYTPARGGNTGGDDGIGGEGLANVVFGASVADTSYGSGAYLNKIPHITAIGTPSIPGGVQADADVLTVKAVHGVVNQAGTVGADYLTGDILTVTTGSPITPAKFTVGALKVAQVTIVTGNDGNTSHGYAIGDQLLFANGVILSVATYNNAGYPANRGVPTSVTIVNSGSYTGTTPPTGTVGHTNTLGGQGFTCNFTWGVKDVTVLVAGVYPIVAGSANTTSVTHGDLTTSTAAGCTLDVYYGVNTIQVTEKGSGYIGTETVTFTDRDAGLSETRATGTIVLTADSGSRGIGTNLNVATNQDNAIIIHANTTGAGTKIGDIQKQTGSHRYKTRTADGVAVCKLVKTDSPAVKQAYITATDQGGAHYWVTKLTAHRAVIWPKGDGTPQYPLINGTEPHRVGWTFGSAVAPGNPNHQLGLVKIENA